jgi:hypothetical protein
MIKKISDQARVVVAFSFLIMFFFIGNVPVAMSGPLTHTVVDGDTLWSICEKYYGDPKLWPKLWQLNPFVTNPHLLHKGDVIKLLEEQTAKRPEAVAEKQGVTESKAAVSVAEPMTSPAGVDVSTLTNIEAISYLSLEEVEPWGQIVSSYGQKVLLSPGEVVFANFREGKDIKPGDQFSICKFSPLLTHPLSGEKLGYTPFWKGLLVVEEHVEKAVFKGRVAESAGDIAVGGMLIPFKRPSSCITPRSAEGKLVGHIVASKNQEQVIGLHSVVYMDIGFTHGVRKGNVFEVLRLSEIRDPEFKAKTLEDYLHIETIPLPYEVVGALLILETEPDTSTALVISYKDTFYNGAPVKGLSWVERPAFLAMIPACPTE